MQIDEKANKSGVRPSCGDRAIATAGALAAYLRPTVRDQQPDGSWGTRQVNRPAAKRVEHLVCDDERQQWMVRWPNGSLKWESLEELTRKGVPPADTDPIIGYAEHR